MILLKIATLLTCHNRREKTISCLLALYSAKLPPNCKLDVFLVDDGSSDGTKEEVKKLFPQVNIIEGNGNLYWNQGMRLAWQIAAKKEMYDFYLWLNDDTILNYFALIDLMECYLEGLNKYNQPGIITGACSSSFDNMKFSYGGRMDNFPVIPNGDLQQCLYINGNVVLVPRAIFEKLGNLSANYTHSMGDFDYGLRAIQLGFKCFTTKRYIAICPTNPEIPKWCDPQIPLKIRWNNLHSPKGLHIKEYIIFRKKFWGKKWIIFALKAYTKSLFPIYYNKISTLF